MEESQNNGYMPRNAGQSSGDSQGSEYQNNSYQQDGECQPNGDYQSIDQKQSGEYQNDSYQQGNEYQNNGCQQNGGYMSDGGQQSSMSQNNYYADNGNNGYSSNNYGNNNYGNNTYSNNAGTYQSYGNTYQPYNSVPGYNDSQLELEEPVKISEWVVSMLLTMIPCVNIILIFVWAFSGSEKKSKSNFYKASLIFMAIWFGIMLLFWIGIIVFVLALS